MSVFENELWLASAGTGKTYRLTNKFISLLLAGVEPERVLATTFTRKAAGEILDRVLERLVDATDRDAGLAELRAAIGDPTLSPGACRSLLVKLTRGLDTFQVRTIDSFFAHLVRLFALDLELPPNWSIGDQREDEALQSEALQDVLEDAERGEMLELLRAIQKGSAKRGVQAALLRRVQELRPIALESERVAWSVLRRDVAIDEAAFERACQALPQAPLAKTAKGVEMANWGKARDRLLADLAQEFWDQILRNGLVKAALDDEPTYYKKPLAPDLLEALAPIVARAKAEVLNDLVKRNEAVRSLLESFETRYAERKRTAGLFRFDDLPQALAPRTARAKLFDEREAELWFRLDGRLDHLLLDEFQDTSPVQWRILAPLASEITSSAGDERSFFCVGDVKQSIYSFRQAEPRLLQNLASLLPGLEAERMDKSYRSSAVVLEAVNLVFETLTKNPVFAGSDQAPQRAAAETWSLGFDTHEAAKSLPGVVHVLEAAHPEEGEAKSGPLVRCAVERVAQILEEAPNAEVGLLTRVNKNIPLLIHALRERGIDASGEGGNALTDSEAVLVYLSLLHLADHPADSAAAFHIQSSRFAEYIQLAPDADGKAVREKARELRGDLLNRGLGEVTASIGRLVQADSSWSAWDQARFAQLVDQAYAFEAKLSLRASDFVDHLRSNRVEAPGGARVRVMTVHASKGLEFDAVVLPELSATLVGQRDSYLVDRPDPAGLIESVMLSPGKELIMLSPELEALYHAATSKAVGDSLCLLYVAMTRAKRRLELILPALEAGAQTGPGTSRAPTYAGLIRGALPLEEIREDAAGGCLWSSSANAAPDEWGANLAGPAQVEAEPEPELVLARTQAPRSLRRRSASSEEGGSRVSAGDLLREGTGARVGTLVHAALEDCVWIEEFSFDPRSLEAHGATAQVLESARAIVERGLASEEVRSALSRESSAAPPGTDLRVEREYEFSLLLEDEAEGSQLWNGAIDRLVLAEEDGRVVWAEVLDYKSDRVNEGELAAKIEYYRPQLEAYARIVAAQTGLLVDQIRLRLAFLSIGRVVDLEG